MNLIDKLSKAVDFMKAPFELLADYAREPLRTWEHDRTQSRSATEHRQDMERSAAEHKQEMERTAAKVKAESDARMREKELETMLPARLAKAQADLEYYARCA
ncbi:hypothetical protein [Cupriavidus sp. H18C2]|uniref:hypothetical protein n=1 Tax=Cupriavidus sp. H18C2 TaxID=3241602 RepID=UPI003BF8F93A